MILIGGETHLPLDWRTDQKLQIRDGTKYVCTFRASLKWTRTRDGSGVIQNSPDCV